MKFGPKNVIVLCDRKAVHELVDKKGILYSDRPHTLCWQFDDSRRSYGGILLGSSYEREAQGVDT